jgi:hypothetical protein
MAYRIMSRLALSRGPTLYQEPQNTVGTILRQKAVQNSCFSSQRTCHRVQRILQLPAVNQAKRGPQEVSYLCRVVRHPGNTLPEILEQMKV